MWTKLTYFMNLIRGLWGKKKTMNEPPRAYNACAMGNGDFIEIVTYSGLGMVGLDPEGARYLLPPDASNEAQGQALRDALAKSRQLTLDEYRKFFEIEKRKLSSATRAKDLMSRYGYKTRHALFKNMINCGVEMQEGVITIRPSFHEKLEGWSGDGIAESDRVKLPDDCTDAELGHGLRLAFSRCWPKTPWLKRLMEEFDDPAQGA